MARWSCWSGRNNGWRLGFLNRSTVVQTEGHGRRHPLSVKGVYPFYTKLSCGLRLGYRTAQRNAEMEFEQNG